MPIFDDETIERLFGAEDAENENPDRFKQYFVYNGAFKNLCANLPIRIVVGHKGVGKSAFLRRSYFADLDENRLAIWIQPNDIASMRANSCRKNMNQLIAEWKEGISEIVSAKALETLIENGVDKISLNDKSGNVKKPVAFLIDLLKVKFPTAVSESQSAILRQFSQEAELRVYLDDIDRGWSASEEDIRSISALLNAVRDMSGEDNRISFRIALRSDVYFLVRTSDESTDKIERNIIWLTWDNHQILTIIAKRILTFFGIETDQKELLKKSQDEITSQVLSKVMDPTFGVGRGHWANRRIHHVLLSLCRKRPRDLVKLMHGSARNAFKAGHEIINSKDLEDSFEQYSNERLQDIINEFKSELPGIEDLLLKMRPTKKQKKTAESFLFKNDVLITKLKNIQSQSNLRFTNNKIVTPNSLIQFLYKIDFITARKVLPDGTIDRKYFEQSRFLANESVDFGCDWEIHPAYRWALSPQDIQDVISSLT